MEKYGRNSNIIDGELDDNQVMMHLEKGKYFGLNPVGKRIWELIEEPKKFLGNHSTAIVGIRCDGRAMYKRGKGFLDKAIESDIITKNNLK